MPEITAKETAVTPGGPGAPGVPRPLPPTHALTNPFQGVTTLPAVVPRHPVSPPETPGAPNTTPAASVPPVSPWMQPGWNQPQIPTASPLGNVPITPAIAPRAPIGEHRPEAPSPATPPNIFQAGNPPDFTQLLPNLPKSAYGILNSLYQGASSGQPITISQSDFQNLINELHTAIRGTRNV
jgi:hypothetical protein